MTRKETINSLGEREGVYTRSLIGKAYDQGFAQGSAEGYNEGFKDANRYGCRVMIACSCLALHEVYGFGEERMQRYAAAFRAKLLDTLDALDAIKECEERFNIIFEDEIFEED